MKRITDPKFRYTPACATDIRKTFARVRREQARPKSGVRSPSATALFTKLSEAKS